MPSIRATAAKLKQSAADIPADAGPEVVGQLTAVAVAAVGLLALLLAPDENELMAVSRLLSDVQHDAAPDRSLTLVALVLARALMAGSEEAQRAAANCFSACDEEAARCSEAADRQAVRLRGCARLLAQAAAWCDQRTAGARLAADIEARALQPAALLAASALFAEAAVLLSGTLVPAVVAGVPRHFRDGVIALFSAAEALAAAIDR